MYTGSQTQREYAMLSDGFLKLAKNPIRCRVYRKIAAPPQGRNALIRLPCLAFAVCCLAAQPAAAHHSLSPYNRNLNETLEGTVKAYIWSNPHVRLVLMVENDKGEIAQWNLESGGVNRLINAGLNRNIVQIGDKITVIYNPRRDGSRAGFFVGLTSASGRKYDTRRNRGPSRGGAEEG
uniref:Uncharacterized protein n=1 Tax=uncultured bacterium BLR7 TaxID=506523 RepID=C0INP2_9BACT|nr:hypothetical protein AKSOIL_0086 [uncultured bacterium BLR7]